MTNVKILCRTTNQCTISYVEGVWDGVKIICIRFIIIPGWMKGVKEGDIDFQYLTLNSLFDLLRHKSCCFSAVTHKNLRKNMLSWEIGMNVGSCISLYI